MADRIKLLKFTLSVYNDMGILPKRLDQKRSSLNRQSLTMLIPLVYYLVFGVAFLIFEAKTITEAGISFYTVTTVLGCLTYFLINMLSNMPKIRSIIRKYEEFIKKRELFRKFHFCQNIYFLSLYLILTFEFVKTFRNLVLGHINKVQ